MMPRYVTKTYGRNSSKEAYTNKAFDDLLKDKRPSTAKAATTGSKWGKTSFTSTRSPHTPTPMDDVDPKKRRLNDQQPAAPTTAAASPTAPPAAIGLFDDPFSFDDHDSPVKKSKVERRASPLTLGQGPPKLAARPVPLVKSRTGAADTAAGAPAAGTILRTLEADGRAKNSSSGGGGGQQQDNSLLTADEEDLTVRKTAIRTYSRPSRNGATKTVIKPLSMNTTSTTSSSLSSSSSAAVTMATGGSNVVVVQYRKSGSGGGSDAGGPRMPVLTITRDRLNRHHVNSQPEKPRKKKFFVSRSVDEDHNYSHKEASHTLAEDEGDSGSQQTKLFESDDDVDSVGDLESGDPEIIFNSPKKRAFEARESKASDNDTLPDDELGRHSPFSITDEEDNVDDAPRFHSGAAAGTTRRLDPSARYTSSYSVTKRTLTLTKAQSTGTTTTSATANDSGGGADRPRERKPIFTYSRRSNSQPTPPSQTSTPPDSAAAASSSSSSLSSSSLGRAARADSPASVGSASSGTSSTSSQARAGGGLKLTYSRKSLSDPQRNDSKGARKVRKLLTSPKKSFAVYNPRPWSSETDGSPPPQGAPSAAAPNSKTTASSAFDNFDDDDDDVAERQEPVLTQPKFRRRVTMPDRQWVDDEPVSTLRVTKEHKPLFTVVRNVKQAHECQEHGETQEFEDDIDYILDGLQGAQKETLRCLSTISLVGKCAMPAFRMHLRAHGTITKIFSALQDAPEYPTLALCTAGVMFMLSRDRLNMDLDKPSLQLMLNLLSVDAKIPTERAALAEYDRMKERIQAICESLKVDGKAKHFHLDLVDISPGKLAMETLLSLTSRKAGDWFKEELRELGGLDHIVSTVSKCNESLDEVEIEPTPAMLNTLRKIERCLRVLENVTLLNADNQKFLLHHNDSELTVAICGAIRVCENCQPFNPVEEAADGTVDKESTGYTVFSCLLAVLRVLLNLTHDNEYGCRAVGQQSGMITTLLRCVLQVPQYISIEQRFDLLVLSLGLLINMVEHSDANRQMLVEETTAGHYEADNSGGQLPAPVALTQFFVARFVAAERLEAEQEADHEQMKKKAERDRKQDAEGGPSAAADTSGQWQESESGLEWVVLGDDERSGQNGRSSMSGGGTGTGRPESEDALSQSSDDMDVLPGSQEEDENFTKALHKAGRHMEDSIIAAYIALLIGVILQNNMDLVDDIRDEMPEGSFEPMVKMLKKFLGFMNFTSSVSNGGKSIIRVIKTLEAC